MNLWKKVRLKSRLKTGLMDDRKKLAVFHFQIGELLNVILELTTVNLD